MEQNQMEWLYLIPKKELLFTFLCERPYTLHQLGENYKIHNLPIKNFISPLSMDTIISDEAQSIIATLIADGADQLHILADFDRTLTQAYPNGKDSGSLISVLYNEGYLSQEYQQTAQAYHQQYSAIEKDETLPFEERKSAMMEWRTKHKQLLIKEGLTKQHIYQAMQSENLQFRTGYQTFFSLLHQYHIPLVILSAGGLGTLSIERYLENHQCKYDNISLVGNDFIWDKTGKAIGFKEPIIHSLNKSETVLKELPVYAKIQERKNVILLGDNPNDVQMIEGFAYKNLLKV
jgi:5'-nucleotidase